jgi:arsenite methyltransferase
MTTPAETTALLAKHHREGQRFAEMMKQTFNDRFNDAFWADWQRWIEPVYSESPRVVDLGAGPGLFLNALAARTPQLRAVGIECAPWMIEAQVALAPGCEVISADLHDPHLPLADGSVDAALASVVLHEMHQPVRALQEMHRVIRPGGRIYILDWVRAPLETYIRYQSDAARVFGAAMAPAELADLFIHFIEHNRFSLGDLVYLLNHTGFAVLHTTLIKDGRYAHIVAERR